jgi:hypothetical protein
MSRFLHDRRNDGGNDDADDRADRGGSDPLRVGSHPLADSVVAKRAREAQTVRTRDRYAVGGGP